MNNIVIVDMSKGDHTVRVSGLTQWDYGQILRIQGLKLPPAVEIHFSLNETSGEAKTRIGVTKDGVTDVVIPEFILETDNTRDYNAYAFVYTSNKESGQTEYKIIMYIKARPKPEAFDKPEDAEIFKAAIEAVNESAKRSETAERSAMAWTHGNPEYPERDMDNARYYAGQAEDNAERTAENLAEVRRLVESTAGITDCVATVEESKKQAQEAAANALAAEQATKEYSEAAKEFILQAGQVVNDVNKASAEIIADREQIEKNHQDIDALTIKQSVSGNTIILTDSAEKEFAGARLFGRTLQQTTAGKNLFGGRYYYARYSKGTFLIEKMDEVKFPYSPDHEINGVCKVANCKKGVSYTLSVKNANRNYSIGIAEYENLDAAFTADNAAGYFSAGSSVTVAKYTAKNDGVLICGIAGYWTDNNTTLHECTETELLQLEEGNEATSFEPYTGGKPSPSPEYPQEIMNAGDKGNINVNVTGKNLFDVEKARDLNNWIYPIKQIGYSDFPVYIGKGKHFTVSYEGELQTGFSFYTGIVMTNNGSISTWIYHKENSNLIKNTFSDKSQEDNIYIRCISSGISIMLDALKNLQVRVTDDGTYEPYKGQSLTLSTPNGFPGIPVSSGGNYTDKNGQQWVCDEIDFGRGMYVQRVWKGMLDGSEYWRAYEIQKGFILNETLPEKYSYREGFCNQLNINGIINVLWIGANNKHIYCNKNDFYDETLEDKGLANWKAHLAKHPLTIMTYLDTPIETPIPDDELAAYRALHTNYPTTVITNDEDCHMQVGYSVDAQNYITQNYVPKATYTALEQRVTALETKAVAEI